MLVNRLMSSPVVSVVPHKTIREAAALMRRHDIGALAVAERGHLVGMVTDRDMVVRVLSR